MRIGVVVVDERLRIAESLRRSFPLAALVTSVMVEVNSWRGRMPQRESGQTSERTVLSSSLARKLCGGTSWR